MVIEYGPPGHKGVTTIMGVGNDGLPEGVGDVSLKSVSGYGAVAALGAWIYAKGAKNKKLAKHATWAAVVLLAVRLLARD